MIDKKQRFLENIKKSKGMMERNIKYFYSILPQDEAEKELKRQNDKYRERVFNQYKYWRERFRFSKSGDLIYLSVSKKLKKDKKINDEFEIMLNSLTLEEIIALKLEIASRCIKGKLYSFPIWNSLLEIVREAVVKYAFSACTKSNHVKWFLGISLWELKKITIKYDIIQYFSNLRDEFKKEKEKGRVK